jgi:hypothetical protein
MVQLYDVINNGYKKSENQKIKGYDRDPDLSNHNHQTYVSHDKKDLIFNVSGTHSSKDWRTNIAYATGNIKKTERYKTSHEALRMGKEKYKLNGVTVTGDSLGGAVASKIHSNSDKAYTFNKASTIHEKLRPSEKSFRVQSDVVSLLGSRQKNVTTLNNQNGISRSKLYNRYKAHMPHNLKNVNINI